MKKLIVFFIFCLFVGQVMAHCGSCGVGGKKNGKDWAAKKMDRNKNMIQAFDLSSSDREKMIALEEEYLSKMKKLKKAMAKLQQDYRSDAENLLSDTQANLYFESKQKKKCCKRKK